MRHRPAPILLVLVGVSAAALAGCATGGVGGTEPPADATPVLFAPGVVSTGDVFASTFTPDGGTVVFTKVATGRPLLLMQSSLRAEGNWGTPEVLPFSGTYRDLDPAFSPDGRRLYFSSRRPVGPSAADTTSLDDTWYVDRTNAGWGTPVHVAGAVNSQAVDMYPNVTRRGALYFDSSRSSRRMAYRAEALPGGGWADPALLSVAINGDSGASNLFVDPDERYVVFAAQRPGGQGGADLHISWRTATGWAPPVNLGPTINTPATEFCPFVSHDGKYLFFTRAVPRTSGQPDRNIYVVRFDALLKRVGADRPPA
jgi:Tol biopolymer transport system component